MEEIWNEYRRTQERSGFDLEQQHPELVSRTKLEEIWAWEDFAVAQYVVWISDRFEPQLIGGTGEISPRERADLA